MSDLTVSGALQPDGTPTGGQSGTTPPAAAAGQPTTGEPAPVTDWERKFKGLQSVHQNLQEQFKVLSLEKSTLTTQLSEIQTQLNILRGELDTTKVKITEKENSITTMADELENYRLLERKTAILRDKAPHLLQFEKHITLDVPDALLEVPFASMTDEQKRQLDAAIGTSIDEFAKVMSSYVAATLSSQQVGVTPVTSPPRPAEPNTDELYKQMMAAAGTPRFIELQKLWVQASEKAAGATDSDGYWRPH